MNNINKAKKVLRISSLFKLVVGSTLLFYYMVNYGIIVILIGLFFFYQSYKDDSVIYNNRVIYLILSIIGISDIIGSVILFICYRSFYANVDLANAPPRRIYSIDKESKKIDILLKLGVVLVFVSGLIFATTSWNIVPDIFKVIALLLFGVLFLSLSIFTENNLKLYKSAFLYWMLSMAFFVFVIIGILYFEIISSNISFTSNEYLAYSIVFLSIAGFLFATHFKYSDKNFLTSCLFALCVSIFFIISYYSTGFIVSICVIAGIALLINIINRGKNETIDKFITILSCVLVGINLGMGNNYYEEYELLLLITSLINLVNINLIVLRLSDNLANYFGLYVSYCIILLLFNPTYELYNIYPIGIMILISIYTLIINIFNDNKVIKYINSCLYFACTLDLFINNYANISCIIIALLFTIFIFIYSRIINKRIDVKIYRYLETFAIAILITSILSVLNLSDSFEASLAIISIIYCIIYSICKKLNLGKDMNILYGISLLIINIISLFNFYENPVIWTSVIIVFTSLYLFIMSYTEDNNRLKVFNSLVSLVLFLSSVFIPFINYNIFDFDYYLVTIAYIIFLLLIVLIFRDKKITNCIVLYALIPLVSLNRNIDIEDIDVSMILSSLIGFYTMFMVLLLFIKNSTLRNIFAVMGCVLLLFDIFNLDSTIACIYVGIIGLVYVIIGFINDKYYPLFIMGVIVILIDLVKSLWDLWTMIPFWLYLLVVGLSIIAFAMNREINKQKKKS